MLSVNSPAHWPKAAASAAVFRKNQVLIVERGKGGSAGVWSLPGGHIEAGETARAAAAREVREETGVVVDIKAIVDVHDAIFHNNDGSLRAHYVLSVYCGAWRYGEPAAASDARSARFVDPHELCHYTTTPRLADFVAAARRVFDLATGPL